MTENEVTNTRYCNINICQMFRNVLCAFLPFLSCRMYCIFRNYKTKHQLYIKHQAYIKFIFGFNHFA
jgi:hypothetical protein